eukprot:6199496-Pleurochrysis_carterae.AAC.3
MAPASRSVSSGLRSSAPLTFRASLARYCGVQKKRRPVAASSSFFILPPEAITRALLTIAPQAEPTPRRDGQLPDALAGSSRNDFMDSSTLGRKSQDVLHRKS